MKIEINYDAFGMNNTVFCETMDQLLAEVEYAIENSLSNNITINITK